MRILHLVSRSQRRGAELVALELAAELDTLGHENRVVAIALGLDGSTDPDLPPLVRSVDLGLGMRASCSWRLRAAVAAEPVDVVLAHGGWPAQVAALGLPRRGPTLVWQRILGFPDAIWRPHRRLLWRAVARRVDAVAALTEDEADEIRRIGSDVPVWVISNFRQPGRFLAADRAVEADRLRRRAGVGATTALVGFVGHLVAQKRPERTVAVLAGVRARGLDAHLVIAGDGPRREVVAAEARDRGVAEHVTFLGHRTDVERVFAGVDLALLTSDAEGIPGVAIEATMTGCPMVTYPVGAVAEVVEHDATGLVLERPEVDLMVDAVAGLLTDDDRRQRMSAACRRRAPEFSASSRAVIYAQRLVEQHQARETARRGPIARARPSAGGYRERGPNLFVIGAPRAGTTYTYHALRRSPEVYMSPVKEPGFFTSAHEFERGIDYYLDAYFARATGVPVRGEATPWYLYSDLARERIAALDHGSEPKFVVTLRRPSARAWSMYRDQRRVGSEQRSFDEAVATERSLLERGDLVPDVRQRYLWCGLYHDHVAAWMASFGATSVLPIVFEELMADPERIWTELGEFLGRDLGPPPFDSLSDADKNPAGELRWPRVDRVIRSFEGRHYPPVEMAKRVLPPGMHRKVLQRFGRLNRGAGAERAEAPDPELMADLDDFFHGERTALAALIGRDLSHWSGGARPADRST